MQQSLAPFEAKITQRHTEVDVPSILKFAARRVVRICWEGPSERVGGDSNAKIVGIKYGDVILYEGGPISSPLDILFDLDAGNRVSLVFESAYLNADETLEAPRTLTGYLVTELRPARVALDEPDEFRECLRLLERIHQRRLHRAQKEPWE